MNWIIKPGFFERNRVGKSQPGLDLSRVIGDWLVRNGFATTTDCCTYSPTGTGGAPYVTILISDTDTVNTAGLASANSQVFVNGQLMTPVFDYTVADGVITFVSTLVSGNTIVVYP